MVKLKTAAMFLVAIVGSTAVHAQQDSLDFEWGWMSDSLQTCVALGDIDGDGDLDLACGTDNGPVSVYLNHDGAFDPEANWKSGDSASTWDLALVDVDNDGDLDLSCISPNFPKVIWMYLNDGGVLEDRPSWIVWDSLRPQTIGPYSLAWGDVDADGDVDLAIANIFRADNAAVLIFFNQNGEMDTTAGWRCLDTLPYTIDLAWADADNDGDLDLACSGTGGTRIYSNQNGVLESHASQMIPATISEATVLAWGDINSDGYADLVHGATREGAKLFMNEAGILQSLPSWTSPDTAIVIKDIVLGDVDRDGDLDILTTSVSAGGVAGMKVYHNINGTIEDTASWQRPNWYAGNSALGDVDGDGALDIAWIVGSMSNRHAKVSTNKWDFLEKTSGWSSQLASGYWCVEWGDVDNDGDADLACGDDHGQVSLYRNIDGSLETFPSWQTWEADWTNDLEWGDVDNDGDLDLACASGNNTPSRVYLNNDGYLDEGTAAWSASEVGWTNSIAWGDVDGDGYLDLAFGNYSNRRNWVFMNTEGLLDDVIGWFNLENESTNWTYSVAWGDYDSDGDLDLACGGTSTDPGFHAVRIYANHNGVLETFASTSFPPHPNPALSNPVYAVAWGDVDGDGDLDLACGTGLSNTVHLTVDGQVQATPVWTSVEMINTWSVVWGDYDNDGDLDLACPSHDQAPSLIYENVRGMLVDSARWASSDPVGPWNADWADMDGDGDLDIAFGNDDRATVHINRLLDHPPITPQPNSPTYLTNLRRVPSSSGAHLVQVSFDLADPGGDDCTVKAEYSLLGGGLWQPATILESAEGLSTSPAGVNHTITWDTDADGAAGYEVWLRLKVLSKPAQYGDIQWPASHHPLRIGHIDGRPSVNLLYPGQNLTLLDSLPLIGRIMDATNFGSFEILAGQLPDTAWESVFHTTEHAPAVSYLTSLDMSAQPPGDYIVRIIALDQSGNRTIRDTYLQHAEKTSRNPLIVAAYPVVDESNVPANAPVVVQFDRDINPFSIDNTTLNLASLSGEKYANLLYDYNSRTMTIVPDKLYTADELHYLVANRHIASQTGNEMGGEFASCFTTSILQPTAAIDSLLPFRGQVETPVILDSLCIFYRSDSDHRYVTVFTLWGDTIVQAEAENGSGYSRVSLSGLLPKTYYIVRVSDDPGFNGDSDYMSYFITEDSQLPLVVECAPADGAWLVGLDDEVVAVFNKLVNTFTVDTSSFYVMGPSGKEIGFYEFAGDTASTVTYAPDDGFEPDATYVVVLTAHIQDHIGNPIAPLSWAFTTGTFTEVGYRGAVISNGGVTLDLPRGALGDRVEVGIDRLPVEAVDCGSQSGCIGLAFDIEPAMELDRPAVLTLSIPDSLAGAEGLCVYEYDTARSEWVYLGGSTVENGSLSVPITHFGRYGLFAAPAAAAEADFASSLSLIPRVISPRTGSFSTSLNVAYRLAEPQPVAARIYDTRGQLIAILVDGETGNVGENLLEWDGKRSDGGYANDGLYVLVIESAGKTVKKTFVILNK